MNIFIHRRDLRIFDNTTLFEMGKRGFSVVPIFIFTPEQIKAETNPYFSNNLVQLMCESLQDLNSEYESVGGSLLLFEGDVLKVLKAIHSKTPVQSIGFNQDYSPYSKERDAKIYDWCKVENISLFSQEDMLLVNIETHLESYKKSGRSHEFSAYKVFSPFVRHCKKILPNIRGVRADKPLITSTEKLKDCEYRINISQINKFYEKNECSLIRKNYREIPIDRINNLQTYDEDRNTLTYRTSELSPYINLGIYSIRNIYHRAAKKYGKNCSFINELYWRDFYYYILNFYPHVIRTSFKPIYDTIEWNKRKEDLEKWKAGKTGFPIVDACMAQLNVTGYMHNRGRMIVASFLTKDLLIDWREGEKYFATKLIDYNIAANNGGWQWAAGCGTDAQAYFRVFNPWTQQTKFDPHCKYVKKWIGELRDLPNDVIINWKSKHSQFTDTIDYPPPMLDHNEAIKKNMNIYKKALAF